MFDNRNKFVLTSRLGRLVLDQDPMGYDDTETSIERSEKTFGIFLTISNNLKFLGRAKEYLETAYSGYGVNAQVKLEKFIKHPHIDDWMLAFSGYLDFTSRNIKDGALQLNFVEGGLREMLTTNIREKFELNREKDLSGNILSPFRTDTLTIEGRDIYLLSKLFSRDRTEFELYSGKWNSGADFREAYLPAPLTVIANSDPENITNPTPEFDVEHGHSREASAANKFYVIADRDRSKTKININLNFRIEDIKDDKAHDFARPTLRVLLRKYTDQSESGGDKFTPVYDDDVELLLVNDPYLEIGHLFHLEHEAIIYPKKGDSYALYFISKGVYGGDLGKEGYMTIYFSEYSGSITWAEDSWFKRTQAKCLPLFNVGERLSEIITGIPCFESSVLSEGKWKDLLVTCGGWVRNMKKEIEIKDEQGVVTDVKLTEWPMTFSWEDLFKTAHAIEPMAYGIMNEGAKQKIVFENIDYFFQRIVTVDLGEIQVEERSTAAEYIYSSITTGYDKGGDYERPLGLDEHNTRSTRTTPVIAQELKLELLSTSRADGYGLEDARRKQNETHPEEDTPYDEDNFLIDAKEIPDDIRSNKGRYYEVRKWQDDFQSAPTGIYSPDTAFNLRITPTRNMLRHSKWFNAGLMPMKEDYLRYASKRKGNNELTTQLIGEQPVKENADFKIEDTRRAMFEPEWVKAKRFFSQDTLDKIQGQTKINGRSVNNFYGMFRYKASDTGETERAFLFSAKIKDEFEFKLLKVYGF